MVGFFDRFKKVKAEKKEEKKSEKKQETKVKYEKKQETGPGKKEPNKESKKEEKKVISKKAKKDADSKFSKILLKPLVTEKAADLGEENKYVFVVAKDANKIEIAKAMQSIYGVKPVKVNVVSMQGKKVRYGRVTGRTKDWKKAVITLKQNEKIEVYEGV